jgi:hypothetical protein
LVPVDEDARVNQSLHLVDHSYAFVINNCLQHLPHVEHIAGHASQMNPIRSQHILGHETFGSSNLANTSIIYSTTFEPYLLDGPA